MAFSASTSLSVTLAHAIAYLTRPLIAAYPATTIIRLQSILEANLTAQFAPSWVPSEPLRGSGRRCLTLSPNCLPPRAVYTACLAAGVQWFDWIVTLGGTEFDFFVDPGCISLRFGKGAKLVTVWSEELAAKLGTAQSTVVGAGMQTQSKGQAGVYAKAHAKTLAQQLLEDDEDEELFAMIADEVNAPSWMTPILDQFPAPVRSESPLSMDSTHSRCSSRSSNSSSGFSFASSFKTLGSCSTSSSLSMASSAKSGVSSDKSGVKLSRREKARLARVYVDTTKNAVTPYDGGKTTVLTGGVMLGAAPSAKVNKAATQPSQNWRRF
ncbi:hypothetical protein SERLA73DRAFT_159149 [Serpula lacrymans var. lacrymans S7.3]|uniref:Anti-proliferative protein domain-containing protein n=2 Tax=Serpula lacrymans var. lacrymans TaxID=341189 RepID=F8PPN5_SERL3|nr:uncharacterized protein SERLADRAFT_414013 [Serpula lacrymans var. lacrymans S7.9]EGO02093.1 hypothetical protein SERLA73DRAFT_159149 [Serpula lacrymans var. lacrymans S7.3]EGO27717.1 hypothetical protein SERLADRAFT_414013 [Serpula lacrymans var. lacrymans S7.9]